jgi:hypothetical protein
MDQVHAMIELEDRLLMIYKHLMMEEEMKDELYYEISVNYFG